MEANQKKLSDLTNIDWLKSKLFSNPDQMMVLQKGDVLLKQGQKNNKVFYIESGRLNGHYKPKTQDSEFGIFTSGEHMIVGIYSFFSSDGHSYTTVIAEEETVLYYAQKDQVPKEGHPDHTLYLQHMVPILANEIYLRQMMVVKKAKEKEFAIKKLLQSEKLATLGQLAAGLAHELNNALGVIHNKTQWMTEMLKSYILERKDDSAYQFFTRGLEKGQTISSSEIRRRRKVLVSDFGLSDKAAKKVARFNLSDNELKMFSIQSDEGFIDRLNRYWETGHTLHDMGVASTHTTHVIKSIKDLGQRNQDNLIECEMRLTVKKSLSLLSNLVKQATIHVEVDKDLSLIAKEGDLIQIWVNLIKNGLESLINSKTPNPTLTISSEMKKEFFVIKIADNGPGIPQELQSKIFQPNVTTKVSGLSFGLGLGLSIVQKIVTGYGGNISVASEPGSTMFNVEFPKSN